VNRYRRLVGRPLYNSRDDGTNTRFRRRRRQEKWPPQMLTASLTHLPFWRQAATPPRSPYLRLQLATTAAASFGGWRGRISLISAYAPLYMEEMLKLQNARVRHEDSREAYRRGELSFPLLAASLEKKAPQLSSDHWLITVCRRASRRQWRGDGNGGLFCPTTAAETSSTCTLRHNLVMYRRRGD
jgi:hypothetical protein